MTSWHFFAVCWLVVAAPVRAEEPAKPVLVVPLTSGPGVAADVAELITDTLTADIQRETGRPILTQKDVSTMLGLERQRALVGCSDNNQCLMEIAGALSAPELVHGSLGRLGDTWVLNLALVDARSGKVTQRYSSRSEAQSAAVFLEECPAAVRQLFSLAGASSSSVSRRSVHLLFVTLRGNVGLPPQDVSATTWFASALAGLQFTPAWSLAVGGLIVRGGGVMVRGAFVPWNAEGRFKPVLGLEVPVLFGPKIGVGIAIAPGFQADLTSWLSLGVDVPVTYFPTAEPGTPALYVFGAATATLRFL